MQHHTSSLLIALVFPALVACTRSANMAESGEILGTGGSGGAASPRDGATTNDAGGPNPENGGVGGDRGTAGSANSEMDGVGDGPGTRPVVECVSRPSVVGVCVTNSAAPLTFERFQALTPDAGANEYADEWSLEHDFDATVVDRGNAPPTPRCWNENLTSVGSLPDSDVVFVDLEDHDGDKWHIELVLPGYDASRFSIGDAVSVELFVLNGDWETADEARYRIARGEELLALVATSTESDVDVTGGTETCYDEDDLCGYSRPDMVAQHGGEQTEIPEGETREVGGLLVTNDDYVNTYDFGICDNPSWFTLGAQPAD